MSTPFTDFLLKLASDKLALKDYKNNPSEAIKLAGLNSDQSSALTSKDPSKISEALKAELSPSNAAAGFGIKIPITLTISL